MGIDILLGQETWWDANLSPDIPPNKWQLIRADHPKSKAGARRRGLLIMVRLSFLRRNKWGISEAITHLRTTHEVLSVHIGPLLLASIYVPCTETPGPQYQALAEHIQGLRKSANQRVVIGGDFNHSVKFPELCMAMETTADLLPLLRPPAVTRMSSDSGAPSGALLDNLFYGTQCPLALAYIGQPEPKKKGHLDYFLRTPTQQDLAIML